MVKSRILAVIEQWLALTCSTDLLMNLTNKELLKNCWSESIKNKIILTFTMLHFFKKYRYHYQNLDDMIYSSWDIEQNILKLAILGHFLPFYPLKTPKLKILKKWKNLLKISSFYTCVQKSQSYHVRFLRYRVTDRIFCHFGLFFAHLWSSVDADFCISSGYVKSNRSFWSLNFPAPAG